MRIRFSAGAFCSLLLLISCVSYEKSFDKEALETNEEFDKIIKIEKFEEPQKGETPSGASKKIKEAPKVDNEKESLASRPQIAQYSSTPQAKVSAAKAEAQAKELEAARKKQLKVPRQPEFEDSEGFNGRRPVVEPFAVGEEVVLALSYFGVEAGKFTLKLEPMVQINGKKAYHFKYIVKSSPLFKWVYQVNDVAETFVDYQTLLPYSYEIHVDESKQVRETRSYFDHKKNKATMWDKKQKKGEAVEEKKIAWDLEEYSQNVFSVASYLRTFTLQVGKKLQVNVGHEGKNILMTAEVLRKEKVFTKAGAFDTFVVKPTFDVDGKFKPTGENFLWLTADDRKFIVRLESKIKIGSIVGEAEKIKEK